ncbi:MAG: FAD:protein FMN transferase [Rhodoferax sp.]|nr:FAD:protein FMN transferase [Rhodoferax sp.]
MYGPSPQLRTTPSPRTNAAPRAPVGCWLKREEAIMGTAIRVELWCEFRSAGEAAIDAVMAEMHRIDRAMSPHKATSELSIINRDAADHAVPLSGEMLGLLRRSLQFSELSDGAFDVTFAAVGRLFDYRSGKRPSTGELAQAREAVGYRKLQLNAKDQTIRFTVPGMCIDLGGFAKGYAVDRACALLRARGITHAHISAGGDSRVMGDRRGRPWSIGVRDPRQPGEVVAVLPLEDTSISTSGDYERYFDEGGVRFHHLIDPASGESPQQIRSVTVLGDDGLSTEAFSKMLFVLGLEKGMRLIEAQDDLDALVVDSAGVLHYSRGLLAGRPQ